MVITLASHARGPRFEPGREQKEIAFALLETNVSNLFTSKEIECEKRWTGGDNIGGFVG